MLMIYWGCLIVGGLFVLLAILGGDHDADADHDFELHLDLDHTPELPAADHDVSHTPGLDTDIEIAPPRRRSSSALGVIRSLKFWTFGLCFFGLTGVVLSLLNLPAPAVFLLALAMGLGIGFGVAIILRWLAYRQIDSLIQTSDIVGQVGIVQIPLKAGSRGRVRFKIKASLVDYIAYTDDTQGFQPGDSVLAVNLENNRLWVVSVDAITDKQS